MSLMRVWSGPHRACLAKKRQMMSAALPEGLPDARQFVRIRPLVTLADHHIQLDLRALATYRMKAQQDSLREGLDQDNVLNETASRQALERTHGSYFLNVRELLDRTRKAVKVD
jgi:hypothetical protein